MSPYSTKKLENDFFHSVNLRWKEDEEGFKEGGSGSVQSSSMPAGADFTGVLHPSGYDPAAKLGAGQSDHSNHLVVNRMGG